MGVAPVLTGNPRTDRALLTLARLADEIARAPRRAGGPEVSADAAAPSEHERHGAGRILAQADEHGPTPHEPHGGSR